MQKIAPHLRAKIRGDAIRILNTQPFTTAFDAFILGVEYALHERPDQNVNNSSSPTEAETIESRVSSVSDKPKINE